MISLKIFNLTFEYLIHIMLKAILKTGLVAGTLDILAAIVLLAKMNVAGVLQYIASGVCPANDQALADAKQGVAKLVRDPAEENKIYTLRNAPGALR